MSSFSATSGNPDEDIYVFFVKDSTHLDGCTWMTHHPHLSVAFFCELHFMGEHCFLLENTIAVVTKKFSLFCYPFLDQYL
jgi:hypothetical protein